MGRDFLESYKVEIDYINKELIIDDALGNRLLDKVSISEIILEESYDGIYIKSIWEESLFVKEGIQYGDYLIQINDLYMKVDMTIYDVYNYFLDKNITNVTYKRDEKEFVVHF